MSKKRYIGEILVEEGLLKPEHLEEALAAQKKRLGEILIESGYLKKEDLDRALHLQVGIARSERYARYLRIVHVLLLVVSVSTGVQFFQANRQAAYFERVVEGQLSLDEVREIVLDESSPHKMEALRSLERYTPGEREELLDLTLRSSLWYVRLYGVLFIQTSPTEHFLPNLVPLTMKEEEPVVRYITGTTLEKITGKSFGADFQSWFNYAKSRGVKLTFPRHLQRPPAHGP